MHWMCLGNSRKASLGLLLLLAGCGGTQADYSQLKLVPAGGRVTLDGQPLVGAVVTFDAEDGQFSYGLTDSDGSYKLQLDSVQAGVTPGKKIVRISTARKILGLNTAEGGGGESEDAEAAERSAERVPPRYNSQSELTVEVTPSQTQYNFDLTTATP
uniref:Carboxypeptidase regulatory-like domain-containing protein n=1 Tax=Schlesneria paludicola TaxID=360056 RepID=A0A7C4QRJ3_9PLAN